MINLPKIKKPKRSLKTGLFKAILLGLAAAALVYVTVSFVCNYIRVNHYMTEDARAEREAALLEELQEYINDNNIASTDTERISRWVEQKMYIYLLMYKGDDLYFASGMYDNASLIPLFSDLMLGGFMDYPTEEEMLQYAKENDIISLNMSDGAVFVSVTEFSEYLFSDISSVLSLVMAMVALTLVTMLHFHKIVRRITRLADDVTVVAEGNMSHSIEVEGADEISKLSSDVENMRSAIISTLESERAAREANTELITSMSHDIRTPLTVLLGYIDIMKTHSKDEEMDEYIANTEKTAMRLKKLSDDMFKYLLVFGNAGQMQKLEEYDGDTLTEQLTAEHILLLKEKGYDVRISKSEMLDGETTVLTNAPELMRIVDNIFSNIQKYADKSKPVDVRIMSGEDRLYMTFSNYVDADASRAESTGIGLKTCVKIAELISCEFSYSQIDSFYTAKLGLISHNGHSLQNKPEDKKGE